MKSIIILLFLTLSAACQTSDNPSVLKVHGIFKNNMVIQRDKPIKIWGWAPKGTEVKVEFGSSSKEGKASGEDGLWEVTFESLAADTKGRELKVTAGEKTIKMDNIVIGDVWVMNGQSNMAFALKAVYQNHYEASMAHLPLLRHFKIRSGAESEIVEVDINEDFINDGENKDWTAATPETVMNMGAIGYIIGSRLQRSLQIPIGIIDTARGGASLESLVPRHMFATDPQAAEYLAWVDQRNKEFDIEAFKKAQFEKWQAQEEKYQKQIAEDKKKGLKKKRRRPRKPGAVRTWSVPGRSPSDAASCYNGMFGVFKGINIKGVAFHQGFNNSMMNTSCKPLFYRKLMKLMVDGWRQDFNNPELPVAIIGFCAGGKAQTESNFEEMGFSTAALIREAQRLGLADVKNTANTVYIANYDQQIPQLHTKKKKELGIRTVRWALKNIYGMEDIVWDNPAKVVSSEAKDGKIFLTFDQAVRPDNFSDHIEGFSIAGKDGIYYMANAEYVPNKDKKEAFKQITVSSPLVKEPVAVRYAWASSPMGNLKVNGKPWQALPCFRTDNFPYTPEVKHQDPEGKTKCSEEIKKLKEQAATALKTRLESTAK